MRRWIAAMVITAAAAAAATPASASDVFRSLAKGVANAAGNSNVERVAVLPFVSSTGHHPEDGMVMAERLIGSLVQVGKVRVVERELLQTIMKEHYLTTSGIVSPEGRRQIGKVLAVDAIVTGSFVSFGRRSAVNPRLIHVETGDILFAETREIAIDWFDPTPIEHAWGSFMGPDSYTDVGCRDTQAQLDQLERALLDLKSRYWMIQAKDGSPGGL